MARYVGRHSARAGELALSAPVRRRARLWTAVALAATSGIVALAITTGGGWDEAVRTFSGEELKERDAQLRSETETAAPEASQGATEPGG